MIGRTTAGIQIQQAAMRRTALQDRVIVRGVGHQVIEHGKVDYSCFGLCISCFFHSSIKQMIFVSGQEQAPLLGRLREISKLFHFFSLLQLGESKYRSIKFSKKKKTKMRVHPSFLVVS